MNAIPRTERYLTMVTPNNNNKFYHMTPNSDGTWLASWGRIGNVGGVGRSSSCTYNGCQWDAKYAEKLAKGYHDISDIYFQTEKDNSVVSASENTANNAQTTEVTPDSEGRRLMKMLTEYAKNFVRENYTIDAQNITPAMVEKGNDILNAMAEISKKDNLSSVDVDKFNKLLSDIFCTIPRSMSDTRRMYASTYAPSKENLTSIVQREADMLDSVSGIAKYVKKNVLADKTPSYGEDKLKIEAASDADIKKIKKLMGSDSYHFSRAWKISNPVTEKAFKKYKKDGDKATQLLWHGSKSQNFKNILLSGLLLNPNAPITGKMFGYGIYFAPRFKKSLGYTSLNGSYWSHGTNNTGLLALFEVATGKPYDVYNHSYELSSFREKDIKVKGCDSLYAHSGTMLHNDEIVVYNENAMTIRYLVEVK